MLRVWARRAGVAAAAATVAAPAAAVAALVATSDGAASPVQLVLGAPRTARTLAWGVWAAREYRALEARYAAGPAAAAAAAAELSALHTRVSRALLGVCEANGGIFVKAAQLAVGLRAVPPEWQAVLASLQDRCPPRPLAEVRAHLEAQLGAPLGEVFAEFEPEARAAASLAQVHRAVVREPAGLLRVAVKLQYPGLRQQVAADLAILRALARLGRWLFPRADVTWLFAELQAQADEELDFVREADNAAELAACFAGRRGVVLPRALRRLCTRELLVMTWEDGVRVSDAAGQRRLGLAPRDVGLALLDAFAAMQFGCGVLHGDPHGGNLLVRADWGAQGRLSRALLGARPRPVLVLLDTGSVVRLGREVRREYARLWAAFVLNDGEAARRAASRLVGSELGGAVLPTVLRPRDWSRVTPAERARLRSEAGLDSAADLNTLLAGAPKPLLDSLRVTGVVRVTAAALGAGHLDRLRINATHVLGALDGGGGDEDDGDDFLRSRWSRTRLWLRVAALRVAAWAAGAVASLAAPRLGPVKM